MGMANGLQGTNSLFSVDIYLYVRRRVECLSYGNADWGTDSLMPLSEIRSMLYEVYNEIWEHLEDHKENIPFFLYAEININYF